MNLFSYTLQNKFRTALLDCLGKDNYTIDMLMFDHAPRENDEFPDGIKMLRGAITKVSVGKQKFMCQLLQEPTKMSDDQIKVWADDTAFQLRLAFSEPTT